MHSSEGIESFLSMPCCPVWAHIFIIVTAVWHGIFAGVWRFFCVSRKLILRLGQIGVSCWKLIFAIFRKYQTQH